VYSNKETSIVKGYDGIEDNEALFKQFLNDVNRCENSIEEKRIMAYEEPKFNVYEIFRFFD
jgi:hypothetical protein